MNNRLSLRLCSALLALGGLLLGAANAQAEPTPRWRLDSVSETTAQPGGQFTFYLEVGNVGSVATDGSPFTVTATLPEGMTAAEANGFDCGSVAGQSVVSCLGEGSLKPFELRQLVLTVDVDGAASGERVARFEVTGSGIAPASTVDPVEVTPTPPGFGIEAFDEALGADSEGTPFTQAAGHPYSQSVSFDVTTATDPSPSVGPLRPLEPVKDVQVDLPPGFLADPTAAERCTAPDLAFTPFPAVAAPLCSPEAQVGSVLVRQSAQGSGSRNLIGPLPLFSMVPPPSAPARFGFNAFGTIVVIDVGLRSDSDYGATARAFNTPEGLAVIGTTVTLWGVPSDPSHDHERACPGQKAKWDGGPSCLNTAPPRPFLRTPTACTAPGAGLTTRFSLDSWFNPGSFHHRSIESHLSPGYPYPESEWGAAQGPSGCDAVPFKPQIEAAPTTTVADSPSGLDFHLRVPQDCWSNAESICSSDLRDAAIELPQGMSLNPSAAAGLEACSTSQIGLTTAPGAAPIHFDLSPARCPDAAKIGSVEIETPLLEQRLEGAVYLAKQGDNPFGSLLAMYLVAEGSGVLVKQAGEIRADASGRLTTVFREAPQTPFSDLQVKLYGGPRGALRTPAACGNYQVEASLTPWSAPTEAVEASDGFAIKSCPGAGFDPKLKAGTKNPIGGLYSPFNLQLSRSDGSAELGGLELTLPQGLLGRLAGIHYCSEAALAAVSGALGTGAGQVASPSCPAASQLGTVTVGAGAGPEPFYTDRGRVYLAGPYKGAPFSLAVVAPALAGPFDLGNVLVRNALHLDPQSAEVSVASDPFPTILHGVPLDLRDVRVELSRPGFILNPTSCDPMAIAARIASSTGASAERSERFQVASCERLGFKPRLSLRLRGETGRSGNPALTAVMRPRLGNANAERIQVALPHSEFLAQGHIRTICTRVQFAADNCPAGSVYGAVTATSPLLDYPLSGKVYLRSSDHPLPDMVLKLKGPATQPVEIDAVGRIDSENGGIRTTFANLPDAPLTKVVLRLPGGKKSLLENSTDICRGSHRATVRMDGHNGKVWDFATALSAKCGKGHGGKRRR